MYHIVSFYSDVAKENVVVPSMWLSKDDDLCLLPPSVTSANIQEIERLAEKRVHPQVGWRMHDVTSLKYFETFTEAKEALERMKRPPTSEQNSDNSGQKRTKRKPAHFSDYTASDDDEAESDGGEVAKILTNALNASPTTNSDPLIVKVEPLPTCSDNHNTIEICDFIPFFAEAVEHLAPGSSEDVDQSRLMRSEDVHRSTPRRSEDPVKCPCNSTCHSLILQSLRRLQRQSDTHTRLLQQLLDRRGKPGSGDPSHCLPTNFRVTLPAVDIKDVEDLDVYLQDDSNLAQLLPYFTEMGGNDARQTLKRIMKKLLSTDLAPNLNWKGRGAKKPFSEYTRVHSLIFRAVKHNPRSGAITLSDTEKYIKDWLRFAPERHSNKHKPKKPELVEKVLRC